MATSQSRERIIRAAWEERGRAEWDPETHGRGLLSLNIPATAAMRPIRFGEPRPPYDNLEFHLVHATMGGQPVNSIVCEDVVVETVEGPIPPPTGWMNSSDDAANQVVQTAAENRRRNMASISSGPTFVPAPLQEQPPQPVGMLHPGVQDHAAQTFTFADNEAVTSWLEGQSEDVAVVFSARAALRVLPTIPFSPWPGTGTRITRETTLGVFRAVATAWAVAAYPGYRRELNDAARAALSGLGDIKALAPLDAAAYASATATGDAGATSHAATVIAYALDAAGLRGRQAFQSLLEALATDAGLLNDRFSAVALAHSKLRPGQIPEWLRISWGELRHALVDADENWGVWTNWYEQRLGGQATSQEIEIARVTIDNAIWGQEPRAVNAHIRELIEEREIFQDALSGEPENPPDAHEIPDQRSAASQFALDAEGRLDLLPDAPLADDLQREMYLEVRHKAAILAGLGHNQLADLSAPIDRFREALPVDITLISINRVWSRGNTLRRHLAAHELVVRSAEPVDPSRLTPVVGQMLRDLVDTFNVFIVGDPKGRELDQIRLGPRERAAATTIIDAALPIVDAIRESQGVVTAAAFEALAEQLEAARNVASGIDGDQAIELSRRTTTNFTAELLRAAYARVRAEPEFAWKEYRAGVYRGLGAVTAAGLAGWPIISFVANNAQALKMFVDQAFHNPTLIQIIDVISRVGGAH